MIINKHVYLETLCGMDKEPAQHLLSLNFGKPFDFDIFSSLIFLNITVKALVIGCVILTSGPGYLCI